MAATNDHPQRRERRNSGNGKPRSNGIYRQHLRPRIVSASDTSRDDDTPTNEPALLPQNEMAERALIGSALIDEEVLSLCASVKPQYFFQKANEVIWRTMQEMREAGHTADYITLADTLRQTGMLEEIGGWDALRGLADHVPHSGHAQDYARIISEKYLARYSLTANATLAGAAYRGDVQEILAAWSATQAEMQEVFSALGLSADGSEGARFRLKGIPEVIKRDPPEWIIPGFLQERKLWLLYGDSNTGKSFLALDMGLSLACGMPWHGRVVRRGAIVYVCAEGVDGISGRLRAWLEHHHISGDIPDFHVIDQSPNLLEYADVSEIINEIKQRLDEPPAAVIFDTLAASMPGADENSSEGMGVALAACRRVQRECGCGVMLVHHSGKDKTRGPRGHSSLRGAFDAALEVTADEETGLITLRSDKGRDFNKRDPKSTMGFRLKEVPVGNYADFTSCILEALDEPPAPDVSRVRRKLTAIDKLLALMQETGKPLLHGQWCTAFIKAGYGQRATFNRALEELYKQRLVECVNGLYQVATPEDGE